MNVQPIHSRKRSSLPANTWILPLAIFLALSALPCPAQVVQQELSADVSYYASLGGSVAVSASGDTALVGAPGDSGLQGSAFIFRRQDGVWVQEAKLVSTRLQGPRPQFGASVALSSDGDTALVGAPGHWDGGLTAGCAVAFVRTGGAWVEQSFLVSNLPAGEANGLGVSVALSADGNTGLIGAPFNNRSGALVFTRSNGSWTEQPGKLAGPRQGDQQGWSVALSSDGNTALVGGPAGAWAFLRSGTGWMQQGGRLLPDINPAAFPSVAVALSADGDTALLAWVDEVKHDGQAWILTRSDGAWSPEGTKLTDAISWGILRGTAATLSADGRTAVVGSPWDDAVFVFFRGDSGWGQSAKLTGPAGQTGTAVALSTDGATLLCGAPLRNSGKGAVSVFGPSHD